MGEIVRKLATIERIAEIHPIPDADAIERAVIRAWNIVVKKGDHKVGDLVVYCEIDSIMPERPEFEFLRPRGFRIKTIKLRGQVSQGIVFPIDIIPSDITIVGPGQDVTDLLGVTKYEPQIPACLAGLAKGNFPSHSIKTDEERIQNLVDLYEEYRTKYTWIATEKLDGSSTTYSIVNDQFSVSSRNLELVETDTNTLWKVARSLNIESKMRKYMSDHNMDALTIQGEILGEGIQKNKYHLRGQTIRFFRVFDPTAYSFLPYAKAIEAIAEMGLDFVPIVERDMTLPFTIDELLVYADGRSALYDTAREGVVFVADSAIFPTADLSRYQGRLSFKVISNKFILKHEE
jgi:RNA ligase (TIGR02306 family)